MKTIWIRVLFQSKFGIEYLSFEQKGQRAKIDGEGCCKDHAAAEQARIGFYRKAKQFYFLSFIRSDVTTKSNRTDRRQFVAMLFLIVIAASEVKLLNQLLSKKKWHLNFAFCTALKKRTKNFFSEWHIWIHQDWVEKLPFFDRASKKPCT